METNIAPNGLWIMIEEPIACGNENASAHNNKPNETETFRDTYDFFPDSGF